MFPACQVRSCPEEPTIFNDVLVVRGLVASRLDGDEQLADSD